MAGLKPAWKFDFAFVALTVGIFWYLWDIRGALDFEDSWPTGPYRFPLVPLVLAGIIFSAEYSKRVGIWLDNRLFSAIAKVSFSVYLFHALVIAVLRKTAFPRDFISFENWLWLVAATLPLSFLLGWIGYELVEKRASEKLRKTFMKNE
jgi:peptidoglycan/LPS O-acetylase OafA/YrhL